MATTGDLEGKTVSVGFVRPEVDELASHPDTIYVCLRPWGSAVGVEMFAEEDFMYDGTVRSGAKGSGSRRYEAVVSNMTTTSREGFAMTKQYYWDMIQKVAKENGAKINDERLVQDGMSLMKNIEGIQDLARIVKPRSL